MSQIQVKRGRKPKKIKFNETEETFEDFQIEEELILKLPIQYSALIRINFDNIDTEFKIKKEKPIDTVDKKGMSESTKVENFVQKDMFSGTQRNTKVTTFTSLYSLNHNEKEVNCNEELKHQKTDIACWWCAHTFDTYIVNLPTKYVEKKDVFKVKGIFCSFECASSYSFKVLRHSNLDIIKHYYRRLYNCRGSVDIKMAPPKEILKMFGGTVDIKDYRNGNHNISYFMNYYPIIFTPHQIGECKINKMINKSQDEIKHENTLLNISLNRKEIPVQHKKIKNIKDFLNSSKK